MTEYEITVTTKDTAALARRCGDCQLCCKLLPVKSLEKGANEKCRHQKHGKGCLVYAKLEQVAPECRVWNCRWLVDDDTKALRRPDRAHYVIDVMPDFVKQTHPDGTIARFPVVQIWCDPAYPTAHRDSFLRAYLAKLGERDKMMALIRYDERKAFLLIPPAMSETGDFVEFSGDTAVTAAYETWPENIRPDPQWRS